MQAVEHRAHYAAFKAKDARFDGRFFVGVSSTGIYCRPICPARLPKETNCTFFDSAALAEKQGFRPCLVCRPELAPGLAPIDALSALGRKAARIFEDQCGSGLSIAEYAYRLGCSERHLRRAFMAEFRVAPSQYLQTCRLLLAKKLLTDTRLQIIDIAMLSGFGSLRRFNDLFKQRYRMPPTALRKKTSSIVENVQTTTVLLGYRPPYRWEHILDFLGHRAIPGVESVRDSSYARTFKYFGAADEEIHGWFSVSHQPEKHSLAITINSGLSTALPYILARVRNLFDLYCCPDAVYDALSPMNAIRPGLCILGTRLPGCFEPFEMVVRAVLGQQITVKAASTLAGRIAKTYGTALETGIPGLTHIFPSAHTIASLGEDIADHLGRIGITRARSSTILCMARKVTSGDLDFSSLMSPESAIQSLTAIPGIGPWTAHYIAMRSMGWTDAFLHTDLGIKKALAPFSVEDILLKAEAWRPWRSYAVINLWNSLKDEAQK